MFDLARAVDIDLDFVEVEFVVPRRVTRHAPHPKNGVEGHRVGDAGGGCQRVVEEVQGDVLGGGGPHGRCRHVAIPCHAQLAAVGVQVVQHAGDLQACCIKQVAVAVHGRNRHLPRQNVGDEGKVGRVNLQRRQASQMGELLPNLKA